jgi:hypothetical protein
MVAVRPKLKDWGFTAVMTGGKPVLPPQAVSSVVKSNAAVAAKRDECVRIMQRV